MRATLPRQAGMFLVAWLSIAIFCGAAGPFWAAVFAVYESVLLLGYWKKIASLILIIPFGELLGFMFAFRVGLVFGFVMCVLALTGLNRAWVRYVVGGVVPGLLIIGGALSLKTFHLGVDVQDTVFWKPWEKTLLGLVTLITPCFLTVMPIRPGVITFLLGRHRSDSIDDDSAPT